MRVGDELAAALEAQGLSVLHDREIYDYPSYTGSYSRSGAAVEEYLAQYPDIAVVIDLHRDALGDGDVTYKTMAELDGQTSSQLMMLVGTGEGGLLPPELGAEPPPRALSPAGGERQVPHPRAAHLRDAGAL